MSVVLLDLLGQEVARILVDMKASQIAAAIKLIAMREKVDRSGMPAIKGELL